MPSRITLILLAALAVVVAGTLVLRPAPRERVLVNAPLPAPLAQAVADGEARLEGFVSLAYTREMRAPDSAADEVLTLTFDPAREEGQWWRAASRTPSNAVEAEQGVSARADEIVNALNQSNDLHGDVVVRDYAFLSGALYELISETDAGWVYLTSSPRLDDQYNDVAEFVRVEVTVAKTSSGPRFAAYRIFAPAPFKPNPAARIDTYDVTLTYQEAWAGGPLVADTARTQVAGSAFFRDFNETVVLRNSDFTPVTAAAGPENAPENAPESAPESAPENAPVIGDAVGPPHGGDEVRPSPTG